MLLLFKKLDSNVTRISETLKEIIDILEQPKEKKPISFTKKTRPGPKPKVRSSPPSDLKNIGLKEMFEKS